MDQTRDSEQVDDVSSFFFLWNMDGTQAGYRGSDETVIGIVNANPCARRNGQIYSRR